MKFTYKAPNEYHDLTSGFRRIESEYLGPHDFKVYVNKKTQLIESVEFDHDGCCEVHGGTDNSAEHQYSVYLNCHNPNHIVLMSMICGDESHPCKNMVEVVCEKYNMVFQRDDPPLPSQTYNWRKCKVSENGIVTYAWFEMVFTWDMLVAQGQSHKEMIRSALRSGTLSASLAEKADYCIEIVDYVINNEISKQHPWKVAWPDLYEVTLDNSMPIGMPNGQPRPDRVVPLTTCWGAVPHDCAAHFDGDEQVMVEADCPVTKEEVDILEPWVVPAEYASHLHNVCLYNQALDALIAEEPDGSFTQEDILRKFAELKAAETI